MNRETISLTYEKVPLDLTYDWLGEEIAEDGKISSYPAVQSVSAGGIDISALLTDELLVKLDQRVYEVLCEQDRDN